METVVPFETLDQGLHCGIRDAPALAIRDGSVWASLWREHTAGRFPERPLRPVDFGGETVVPFFQGERATGGYAVPISHITERGARPVVRVEAASPEPGHPVIQAGTQPYQFVNFPRSDPPTELILDGAELFQLTR